FTVDPTVTNNSSNDVVEVVGSNGIPADTLGITANAAIRFGTDAGHVDLYRNLGSLTTGSNFAAPTATLTGANALTLGTASSTTGAAVFQNSANANTTTLQGGAAGSNITFTLPTNVVNGDLLTVNGTGQLSW